MSDILDNQTINNINLQIYNYGTQSKNISSLPSALQNTTSNNATEGTKITNSNIEQIKSAIKILEQKFSNNCCQSQCNSNITQTNIYTQNTCQTNQTTYVTKYTNCKTVTYNCCGNGCTSNDSGD